MGDDRFVQAYISVCIVTALLVMSRDWLVSHTQCPDIVILVTPSISYSMSWRSHPGETFRCEDAFVACLWHLQLLSIAAVSWIHEAQNREVYHTCATSHLILASWNWVIHIFISLYISAYDTACMPSFKYGFETGFVMNCRKQTRILLFHLLQIVFGLALALCQHFASL